MTRSRAQHREEYSRLVAAGLCPTCYKPAIGGVKCAVCRERHNVTRQEKRKQRGIHRFSVPRTHYHMTPEEITRICGLYAIEMKSIPAIALELQWPRSRIRDALIKGGVSCRTRNAAIALAAKNGRMAARPSPVRHSWKGGTRVTEAGYIQVWVTDPVHKRGGSYIFEHRQIWEAHNGPLPTGWIIHHINGIKSDNRLENLLACSARDHAALWSYICNHIQHLEREIAELKTDVEALRRQRCTI